MIPLLISAILAFHPTIDGQRVELPNTVAETPYMLGISVPPPDLTLVTVTHNDLLYYMDYCQGTIELGWINSGVVELEGGGYHYQIVPEPSTLLLLSSLLIMKIRGIFD